MSYEQSPLSESYQCRGFFRASVTPWQERKINIMNDQSSSDTVSSKDGVALRKQWYPNRNWRFLLFNVVFATAFFGPLRDLARTSLNSDYDTYIPLIPFISAYLMHLNRKMIFSEKESFSVVGLLQ
jgi:hypothetical protein